MNTDFLLKSGRYGDFFISIPGELYCRGEFTLAFELAVRAIPGK